jgi:hypothetical protein
MDAHALADRQLLIIVFSAMAQRSVALLATVVSSYSKL